LSSFKKTIGILKKELERFGITAFVAHEDIEPTKEWQEEIEKGLFSMDALCAVLIPGFKESNWTDQEIGVAIGRGVLVIPVRKELDPYGFIGKYQGYQALGKNIGEVAEGIFQILVRNPKTRNKMLSSLIDLFLLSNDSKDAIERLKSLKKIKDIPTDKYGLLHQRITENMTLKNQQVLDEFNGLIRQSGLRELQFKDFEKVASKELDDLPF
jgi:hypothetical protein